MMYRYVGHACVDIDRIRYGIYIILENMQAWIIQGANRLWRANSPLDSAQIEYKHRWGFLCYSTKQQLDKQSTCLWFNSSSLNAANMGSMNWVSISSGTCLSPVWRQAITWTNADLLSTGPLATNFCEIQIKIQSVSFMKMHLKMPSAKWRSFLSRVKELR